MRETVTLKQLLDYGRSLETSEIHARGMEKTLQFEREMNYVNKTTHQQSKNVKTFGVHRRYYRCNGTYPHAGVSVVMGKTCNMCSKLNHFTRGGFRVSPVSRTTYVFFAMK